MKKTYQFPVSKVVKLQTVKMLCESTSFSIGGKYNGSSAIEARGFGGWDDDDE